MSDDSNPCFESISTVQLSPFNEEQWHRSRYHAPMRIHWTDIVTMKPKPVCRTASGKLNAIGSVDLKSSKLDDELLFRDLRAMRKVAAMPLLMRPKKGRVDHPVDREAEELDRKRTTTPADDYLRSREFSCQTEELSNDRDLGMEQEPTGSKTSFSYNADGRPPSTASNTTLRDKSITVQLRQSAKVHAHTHSVAYDGHRSVYPVFSVPSPRAVATASSIRQPHGVQARSITELSGIRDPHGLGSFVSKQPSARSTTASRSSMRRMRKRKPDHDRQKQPIGLNPMIVHSYRQPLAVDVALNASIPNSIEMMRQLGGCVPAFEHTLRYNYYRQLNHFRLSSIKC